MEQLQRTLLLLQLKANIFTNIQCSLPPHLKNQNQYTGVIACDHLVLEQSELLFVQHQRKWSTVMLECKTGQRKKEGNKTKIKAKHLSVLNKSLQECLRRRSHAFSIGVLIPSHPEMRASGSCRTVLGVLSLYQLHYLSCRLLSQLSFR